MAARLETIQSLTSALGPLNTSEFRGDTRVVVPRDRLLSALSILKSERQMDLLVDITCVDYLHYRGAGDRFGLVYLLGSSETAERLTLRVFVNEPDLTVPSAVGLYEAANWLEREIWDMFGIRFAGHPDHRRILLPEPFTAHPLRKDYPLQGRGERHNFPVLSRNQG